MEGVTVKASARRAPDVCDVECVHPDQYRHARERLLDGSVYTGLADLFGALADPTRVKIVHLLREQELCSCDLAAAAGVSRSGASQHLRLLRALRLVKFRRAGRLVYYSLDDEHVAALLRTGLAHVGHTDTVARAEESEHQAASA
jgi:ArsR family transcriptional regulator, lead/cadmium/zinc/bismuth-responsive transcriptional repressor